MKDALIICTRNRSNHIDRLLNELAELSHGPSLIVIVDSSNTLQTYEIVKKHNEKTVLSIEYVHSLSGLPLQRNKGIDFLLNKAEDERPEIIHFVDDDVSVQYNYFSRVNNLFDESPNVIAVGGFDKNTNGNLSNGIARRFLLLGSRRMGVVLRSGICIPPLPQSREEEVEWLPGLSQSFRAKIFDKIRFDSKISIYGEDIDFYLRVREIGTVICSNELPVDHLREPSDRDRISTSTMYSDGSRWSLAHKYPHAVSHWAVVFSTAVLLAGELILGLLGKGKNHFYSALGHIWFFVNLLLKRTTEKTEYT